MISRGKTVVKVPFDEPLRRISRSGKARRRLSNWAESARKRCQGRYASFKTIAAETEIVRFWGAQWIKTAIQQILFHLNTRGCTIWEDDAARTQAAGAITGGEYPDSAIWARAAYHVPASLQRSEKPPCNQETLTRQCGEAMAPALTAAGQMEIEQ